MSNDLNKGDTNRSDRKGTMGSGGSVPSSLPVTSDAELLFQQEVSMHEEEVAERDEQQQEIQEIGGREVGAEGGVEVHERAVEVIDEVHEDEDAADQPGGQEDVLFLLH